MPTDTIHTIVYDTIHTVSFDTVKVILDSSFTPQVLRDSQAFYTSSFNNLLVVFSVFAAIYILVATIIWGKKVKLELDKLKKEFNSIADSAAQKAANKATEQAALKIEQSIEKQRHELDELKMGSRALWHENLMDVFVSAYKEKNPVSVLDKLNSFVLKVSSRFDDSVLKMLCDDVLPLYERSINSLGMAKGFDSLLLSLSDRLNHLRKSILSQADNTDLKKRTLESIDNVLVLMKQMTDKFKDVQAECDNINREIADL